MAVIFAQLPMELDINFVRGDTLEVPLTFQQNTGTTAEPVLVPRDLSGHTFLGQVRVKANVDEVLATFEVLEVDFSAGKLTLRLDAGTTSGLPKKGVYDVQSTDPEGRVRTWLRGAMAPEPDVTRVPA